MNIDNTLYSDFFDGLNDDFNFKTDIRFLITTVIKLH